MTNDPPMHAFPEVVDAEEGRVSLAVEEGLYPLDALYGAAYVFIDRCYVWLDRPETGRLRVTLTSKRADVDEGSLRALAGEFGNELLSSAWRHRITQQNRALIESVTAQALAGAMGPPSLDDLMAYDFASEPFEDPLGIAVSWEEKYKKKAIRNADDGGEQPSGETSSGEKAP